MTESDTDFLSRMLAQSSVPQGHAAHPDMTRLLKMAAEVVRLRAEIGKWEDAALIIREQQKEIMDVIKRITARAALKKESTT